MNFMASPLAPPLQGERLGWGRARRTSRSNRPIPRRVPARYRFRGTGPDRFRAFCRAIRHGRTGRSEEHTSELQSLMRISYAVFCLKQKTTTKSQKIHDTLEYSKLSNKMMKWYTQ